MAIRKIDFNPDLFNPIYWELEQAFNNPDIRFIWVYGGSSAAKTYSVVQLINKIILGTKDENHLVLRKYATDIRDSIYSDFTGIINEWKLPDYYLCQQNYVESNLSGSYVRFRGLDDSEKVKGISQFKRVVMEEVNQFDLEDYKQVRKRLRGREGQQVIGIFNPVSIEHWIKTEVFDKDQWIEQPSRIAQKLINAKGNALILRTNYKDNRWIVGDKFVDQHVIDDFEHDRENDENAYRVYGLGEWGFPRTGMEMYHSFNYSKHVKPCPFNPTIAAHPGFDFNVNPYMSAQVVQIVNVEGRWKVRFTKEYAYKHPANSSKAVSMAIAADLEAAGFNARLFYYGDYSGKNKNTLGDPNLQDNYQVIQRELSRYLDNQSNRVYTNPSVQKRVRFINAAFQGKLSFDIEIDPSCKKLIEDLSYLKQGVDGNKHKEKVKDPISGVSYEKWGHMSDVMDYIICAAFKDEFNRFKG